MDHDKKIEYDKFDSMDSTIYILVTKGPKLLNGMRLNPTTSEYDLQAESWSYLTDGMELPCSDDVYCAGRWVGQSTRKSDGMIGGGLLMMGVHDAAKQFGFSEMFGVTTSVGKQWFDKRKIPNSRQSEEFFTGREQVSIFLHSISVGDEYLQTGSAQYEAGLSALEAEKVEVTA